MIGALIRAAIRHRLFVLLAAVALALAGVFAALHTPIDALPDLTPIHLVASVFAGERMEMVIEPFGE